MLIKVSEYLKRYDPLMGLHRGTVVKNDDPDKAGAIKCTIPGIYDGVTDNLPWIHLRNPYNMMFQVPPMGAVVTVEFPFHDIYAGFYFGTAETTANHQADFDENYPDTYGWVDETGNKWVVNKKLKTMKIIHNSGYTFTVEETGDVTMEVPGQYNVKVTDLVKIVGALIKLDGGGGQLSGIVTQQCICAFTGNPHPMASSTVEGSL